MINSQPTSTDEARELAAQNVAVGKPSHYYVRYGDQTDPDYDVYGANVLSVKSHDAYNSEAEANADVMLKELKYFQQEYFHSLDSEEFISMILKITAFKWEEVDVLLDLTLISSLN